MNFIKLEKRNYYFSIRSKMIQGNRKVWEKNEDGVPTGINI